MSQDMKQQEPVTDAELDPVLASKVDAYLTLVQDAATELEERANSANRF